MTAGVERQGLPSEIEDELHDLCQPLTMLQCRLALGRLARDPETLLEAVNGGLEDVARVIESVRRLRQRLLRERSSAGVELKKAGKG